MRSVGAVLCALVLLGGAGFASAQECPGNPNALGTSRTLVVDPTEHPRIGTMQYRQTLPLADKEVVLTFDDGPLPRYSKQILNILASECVKATYFLVGRMAQTFPETVREIRAAGHTIGTHSQNHPLSFQHMPIERVQQEVDGGIESVKAALGDDDGPAPFFRIPGLLRAEPVETYLASRGLMAWSADFPADDWKHISAAEITRRALMRLEMHGKGILLLHDIHPATVTALPTLLHELKVRGYHIVHVVAATPTLPATPTEPDQWYMHPPVDDIWPRVAAVNIVPVDELAAPPPSSFGLSQFVGPAPETAPPIPDRGTRSGAAILVPPVSGWPRPTSAVIRSNGAVLPVPALPSLELFDVPSAARQPAHLRQLGTRPHPIAKATHTDTRPAPRTKAEAPPSQHLTGTVARPEIGFP